MLETWILIDAHAQIAYVTPTDKSIIASFAQTAVAESQNVWQWTPQAENLLLHFARKYPQTVALSILTG